jgi:hypothetical protein
MKIRFMVLDPWQGTLKIYKDRDHYPMIHKKL